jgi:hypothetical protein
VESLLAHADVDEPLPAGAGLITMVVLTSLAVLGLSLYLLALQLRSAYTKMSHIF